MAHENTESGSRSKWVIELTLAWMAVGVPLLWGVVQTLQKAMALFS